MSAFSPMNFDCSSKKIITDILGTNAVSRAERARKKLIACKCEKQEFTVESTTSYELSDTVDGLAWTITRDNNHVGTKFLSLTINAAFGDFDHFFGCWVDEEVDHMALLS